MRSSLVGCVVGASLAATAAAAAETGMAARDALRDPARQVLAHHCDGCHQRGDAKAVPRALAVFDLTQPLWPATMSDEQLGKARGRLAATRAAPAERDAVARFVAAELQARRAR